MVIILDRNSVMFAYKEKPLLFDLLAFAVIESESDFLPSKDLLSIMIMRAQHILSYHLM